MATPGAAGVAALMLQANPDPSPFDIRNIMRDATYRQCHYMGANEPCAEDLIQEPQNNVYGHGEVRALDALLEKLSVTICSTQISVSPYRLRQHSTTEFISSEATTSSRGH